MYLGLFHDVMVLFLTAIVHFIAQKNMSTSRQNKFLNSF